MTKKDLPLNFDEIQKSFQEKYYVNVLFPVAQLSIDEAVQSFFKFLDEADDVKNHIDFKIATKHRRGDIGFKHRHAEDDIYNDSKEFFHFHPVIFEEYADFLKTHPVVEEFMLKANSIWDSAYKTVHQILSTFEPSYPGVCMRVFDVDKSQEHVHVMLRFLKYDWQKSGKYLAKPHFDSGSFTLAISESCQGLRIGSNPQNLKSVEHIDGNAIFMLSSNFRKIIDAEHLLPGWHDVIQTDDSMIGRPFARWAVVAFIESFGVEALPRTETHK